jgi:hypothetical protein
VIVHWPGSGHSMLSVFNFFKFNLEFLKGKILRRLILITNLLQRSAGMMLADLLSIPSELSNAGNYIVSVGVRALPQIERGQPIGKWILHLPSSKAIVEYPAP